MNRLSTNLLVRDIQLFNFMYTRIRNRYMNRFMLFITRLGGGAFTISTSLLLIISGMVKLGLELIFLLTTSHLLVHIIKRLANRSRPYNVLDNVELIPGNYGRFKKTWIY